eukprot:gene9284-12510_t
MFNDDKDGNKTSIVEVNFSFHSNPTHSFSIVNPAPIDINKVSQEAEHSRTSYDYSGRHDHGKLPLLKSTGYMSQVISALLETKNECDRYLTECIDAEYGGDKTIKLSTNNQDMMVEDENEHEDKMVDGIVKKPRIEEDKYDNK